MLSEKLLSELQIILKEDYQLNLDLGATADVGYSLTNYFEQLILINKERKE